MRKEISPRAAPPHLTVAATAPQHGAPSGCADQRDREKGTHIRCYPSREDFGETEEPWLRSNVSFPGRRAGERRAACSNHSPGPRNLTPSVTHLPRPWLSSEYVWPHSLTRYYTSCGRSKHQTEPPTLGPTNASPLPWPLEDELLIREPLSGATPLQVRG